MHRNSTRSSPTPSTPTSRTSHNSDAAAPLVSSTSSYSQLSEEKWKKLALKIPLMKISGEWCVFGWDGNVFSDDTLTQLKSVFSKLDSKDNNQETAKVERHKKAGFKKDKSIEFSEESHDALLASAKETDNSQRKKIYLSLAAINEEATLLQKSVAFRQLANATYEDYVKSTVPETKIRKLQLILLYSLEAARLNNSKVTPDINDNPIVKLLQKFSSILPEIEAELLAISETDLDKVTTNIAHSIARYYWPKMSAPFKGIDVVTPVVDSQITETNPKKLTSQKFALEEFFTSEETFHNECQKFITILDAVKHKGPLLQSDLDKISHVIYLFKTLSQNNPFAYENKGSISREMLAKQWFSAENKLNLERISQACCYYESLTHNPVIQKIEAIYQQIRDQSQKDLDTIAAYLILPAQRVMRYNMLFEAINFPDLTADAKTYAKNNDQINLPITQVNEVIKSISDEKQKALLWEEHFDRTQKHFSSYENNWHGIETITVQAVDQLSKLTAESKAQLDELNLQHTNDEARLAIQQKETVELKHEIATLQQNTITLKKEVIALEQKAVTQEALHHKVIADLDNQHKKEMQSAYIGEATLHTLQTRNQELAKVNDDLKTGAAQSLKAAAKAHENTIKENAALRQQVRDLQLATRNTESAKPKKSSWWKRAADAIGITAIVEVAVTTGLLIGGVLTLATPLGWGLLAAGAGAATLYGMYRGIKALVKYCKQDDAVIDNNHADTGYARLPDSEPAAPARDNRSTHARVNQELPMTLQTGKVTTPSTFAADSDINNVLENTDVRIELHDTQQASDDNCFSRPTA